MRKFNFTTLGCILTGAIVCLGSANALSRPMNDDVIGQDGFLIGRQGADNVRPDTIVKQGQLPDGTRFFIYPDDSKVVIQRAGRGDENAIIAAGNIAADGLDTAVRNQGGVDRIPLYSDANIFCQSALNKQGRVDIRYKLKPCLNNELRQTSYILQHAVLVRLLAAHINNCFAMLAMQGKLPPDVNNVQCIDADFLYGEDLENICIHVDAQPGRVREAEAAVRQCLVALAGEDVTESQINQAKWVCIEKSSISAKVITEAPDAERLLNHARIKRIADSFVVGNTLIDANERSNQFTATVLSVTSDFLTEVFRRTVAD
ncbi:MAG: hypothetical protein KBT10_02915 [Bacteroidales bacterium]|nr:hypothetical protein [Candidatus Sodaliphilus aphodohippi]